MTNKTKNIFLVVLAILFVINIAALVTIVIMNKKKDIVPPNAHEGRIPPGDFDDEKMGQGMLFRELGLSNEQNIAFHELKDQYVEQVIATKEKIKEDEALFIQLLSNEIIDEDSLDVVYGLLAQDFIEMKKHSAKHLLEIKEILNPEQEKIFFEKIKEHSFYFDRRKPGSGRHFRNRDKAPTFP
jgi:Spy/CpxP family protein refolding chaperone